MCPVDGAWDIKRTPRHDLELANGAFETNNSFAEPPLRDMLDMLFILPDNRVHSGPRGGWRRDTDARTPSVVATFGRIPQQR